jgi:2,3-bisphosphoglycerate-independent phosphoglycerate mutase
LYKDVKGNYPARATYIDGRFCRCRKHRRGRDVISLIDRAFFGELLPKIAQRDTVVAVTADHATPWALQSHSADPVPLLLAGGSVRPMAPRPSGEREAARGGIGQLLGVDIMPLLARAAH